VDPEASSNDQRLDRVRRAALVEWEAMAPGWERRREYLREFSQGITDWMVARLDPQPGQTILELGAGTGETGFAAARLIGDGGRLISTDLPPGMVEVAKRRAEELGVENAEFRVMDAEHIDLEAGSIDGILCRWAFMLMPDPGAAMVECSRVLRPRGRLALAVMGGSAQNPWASSVAMSIVGLGLISPIDPKAAGGVISLAEPDHLRELLVRAGFDDVRIEEMEFHLQFSDFEDYWNFVREFAGAVAILLRSFTDEERAAVREATERATEGFRAGQGYDLPSMSVNALAS
jgi:ubiquinone/menaquinone biosynthesis C-methylase UbiE